MFLQPRLNLFDLFGVVLLTNMWSSGDIKWWGYAITIFVWLYLSSRLEEKAKPHFGGKP
jgi:hypothetical protein